MDTYEQTLQYMQRNRRTFLFIVGLSAVVMVTFLPTIFYIWDPPAKSQDRHSGTLRKTHQCHKGEVVNWESLIDSPCSSHFNWNQINETSVSRNITTLECDFKDTDDNLKSILSFWSTLVKQYGEDCGVYARHILCHHLYGDCVTTSPRPTTRECLRVKTDVCKDLWAAAEEALNLLPTFTKCIAIPNCTRDFNDTDATLPTLSGFPVGAAQDKVNQYLENTSDITCTPPLVRTELRDITPYVECSPKCLHEDWTSEAQQKSLEFMIYLTAVVSLFCVVITFITWGKVAELRQFPQSTLLYFVIAYTIGLVGFTIPLVVGRRNAYCSHDDLLSMWRDPSVICIIQGSLVHFGVESALVWWLCSVFNVFVSVYVVSPVNPIRRYSKLVFLIEAMLSVIVPGALVAVVLGTEGKYAMFSNQVITCGPPSLKLFYYTMAFPAQLIVLVGVVMTAGVVLRLQKAEDTTAVRRSSSRRSVGGRRSSSSSSSTTQTKIKIRFLMIIVFFPVVIGVIMSSILIYSKLSENVAESFMEYISCIQKESEDKDCSDYLRSYSGIITCIVNLLMFDVLSVVVFAYVLAPRLARKYWMHLIRDNCNKLAELVTGNKEHSESDNSEVFTDDPTAQKKTSSRTKAPEIEMTTMTTCVTVEGKL